MDALTVLRRLIYIFLDIILLLLGIRFLLRLFGANMATPFAEWILRITAPFMAPFAGIFGSTSAEGSVIEWSVLVAMIVWSFLAYAIIRILSLAFHPHDHRVVHDRL